MTPRNCVWLPDHWCVANNQSPIVLPMDPSNLAAKSGVAYIPRFTPAKHRLSSVHSSDGLQKGQNSQRKVAPFSVEKLVMFNTRYENGYDLSTDSHYNEWPAQYHPQKGM